MTFTLVAAVAAVLAAPSAATVHRHFTPEDREAGRYQYVPVDVPAGTTRLTIRYAYDKAGGANVIDLGLLEPGPLDLGTPALRGWSGGERATITLSKADATPGYWPGPLPAGRWNVILGLYKVAPAGVDADITVETSREPVAGDTPALAPRDKGPLRTGPAWYAGGLHLHTVHSDGKATPQELARRAREAGLDFIVITDHNNTTNQLERIEEPGLLRMVGEEITTPAGHACVWGLSGWREVVDFRVQAGDPRIADLVKAARAKGALVSINHPRAECLGCAWQHAVPEGVTGIEISNGGHPERAAAIAMWDSLLRQGRRLVAVGSADWHELARPIASASVRVWAPELSERAILDGIAAGRVVVMADGRTAPPELVARVEGGREARVGDTLEVRAGTPVAFEVAARGPAYEGGTVEFFWNGEPAGTAPIAGDAPARLSRTIDGPGYLRVHVAAADGSPLAVTNPIFFTVPSGK